MKLTTEVSKKFFEELPIFAGLSENNISSIIEHAIIKRYDKGKLLFIQGDKIENFYIMRSGMIKLFRTTESGKESIISLFTEGDTFMCTSVLEVSSYSASGQIIEDAILYEIPSQIMREAALENYKLTLNIITYISNMINKLSQKIEQLSIMEADKRVGCFLLHICRKEVKGGQRISLPCNKELIANYLGMTPETFSRSLFKLKKLGVSVERDKIVVESISNLQKYTCQSCSKAGDCVACSEKDWYFCSLKSDNHDHIVAKKG